MDFPNIEGIPVALDTETTGLKFWSDRIFSFSLSVVGADYYWDIREEPGALEWLRDNINKASVIYMYNAKFDIHMLREAGVDIDLSKCVCAMIRAALIDEHLMSYSLDYVGKECVQVGKDSDLMDELKRIYGSNHSKDFLMKKLSSAPRAIVEKYAKQDTNTTLKLALWQEDEIIKQDLQQVDRLERDLFPAVIDMELQGVRVDIEKAEEAVRSISVICDEGQARLNLEAGFEVNPNPSNSIKKLFDPKWDGDKWVLNDGTIAESTDAGNPSIDASCLRRMRHPLAAEILKIRKLLKARDTFLNGHILGYHDHGVIHCNINQTKGDNDAGTGTGRLSINSPALQQISARDKEIAAIVRAIFIPDFHDTWLSIDWAQVDFRVAAHYIQDPNVMENYAKNPDTDFHQLAADLTGLPRSPRFAGDANAKQINLAMAFNMGAGKLAAEMGLPFTIEVNNGRSFYKPGKEAAAVFEKYHSAIPSFKTFSASASSVAASRGYVWSLARRKIRFPDPNFAYKASGLLYQSGAADMQKIKIIECHKLAKEHGARLMLSVHDELNFSAPDDPDIIASLNDAYCDFHSDAAKLKLRVPIRSSVGVGPNWWEASK